MSDALAAPGHADSIQGLGMTATLRPRRRLHAALTAALALALAGCSADKYPNTIFEPTTEFNR
jgi:ABC-type uncharacterized transport system auxiliary subunit